MIDRAEQQKRGGQTPRKTNTAHPYAAIQHRVIDSPAFADLKPQTKVVLLLIARQLTKSNNGHLQATFDWCTRYGIGSEHTLQDAIAALISHGFIYRTRSRGANKAWAKYAVTWLPITEKKGLFLHSFKPCAWRDWEPIQDMPNKNSSPQKVQDQSGKNCRFTPENPAKTAGSRVAKTAEYELCTNKGAFQTHSQQRENVEKSALIYRLVPANEAHYQQFRYSA